MLLTDAERARFAEYLEAESTSADAIGEQMAKLGGLPAELAKRERIYAAACRMVAAKLRPGEAMTIGRPDGSPSDNA